MARTSTLHRQVRRHLDDLPILPTVVAQLMALDPLDEKYFDSVLHLIESDPNFSARVMVLANSSANAARSPVTTLRAAIARIGSKGASSMIISMGVATVFVPRDPWERSLWRHALQVALLARALARRVDGADVGADEAYLGGLLHDMGRFILFQVAPDKLREVDEGEWSSGDSLMEVERAVCGTTHTELGALACEKWNLPESITTVVRDHHTPRDTPAKSQAEQLTEVVKLADMVMFPSAMPGATGLEAVDETTAHNALVGHIPPFLTVEVRDLQTLMSAVIDESDDISSALGIY